MRLFISTLFIALTLASFSQNPAARDESFQINFQSGLAFNLAPYDARKFNKVALLDDDRILVTGGFYNFGGIKAMARLLPDGQMDNSFNSNINGTVMDLEILADGRLLITGYFTINEGGLLYRNVAILQADGAVDPSFPPMTWLSVGSFYPAVYDASIDGDEILLAGNFSSVNGTPKKQLIKVDFNGAIDEDFDIGDGIAFIDGIIFETLTMPDSRIACITNTQMFSGYNLGRVVILFSDGQVDPSVDLNISVSFNISRAEMALQSNGKLLVNNGSNTRRYNSDFTLDQTFNMAADGIGQRQGLKINADDSFMLFGRLFSTQNILDSQFVLRKFDSDGIIDNTYNADYGFGEQALFLTFHPVKWARQSTGKIIVAHYSDSYNEESLNLLLNGQNNYQFVIRLEGQDVLSTTNEPETLSQLEAWPNPSSGNLSILIESQNALATRFRLLDISGRKLRRFRFTTGTNSIDLSDLSNGSYILVSENGRYKPHRIVLSR